MRVRRASPPETCPRKGCNSKLGHGPFCFAHMGGWRRSVECFWWTRYGFFSDDFYEAMVQVFMARVEQRHLPGVEAFHACGKRIEAWVAWTARGRCAVQWDAEAPFAGTGWVLTACGFRELVGPKSIQQPIVGKDGTVEPGTVVKSTVKCVVCQAAWAWKESGLGPWPYQQKEES